MRHQTQQAQQAREAKLEALHVKLTESVSTLVSGDDWRRALEFSARFRSRSFNNTMLIYLQHYEAFRAGRVPSATPTYVAGFKQWQTLGRQVMKGQSGYGILAPVTARFASRTPNSAESWRRLGRGERSQPGVVTEPGSPNCGVSRSVPASASSMLAESAPDSSRASASASAW